MGKKKASSIFVSCLGLVTWLKGLGGLEKREKTRNPGALHDFYRTGFVGPVYLELGRSQKLKIVLPFLEEHSLISQAQKV